MEIEKKLSFAEMREHTQARKNNSDLANLSTALDQIALEKQELKKQYEQHIKELEELEAEINSTATKIEGGEIVPVEEISRLYHSRLGKSGKHL